MQAMPPGLVAVPVWPRWDPGSGADHMPPKSPRAPRPFLHVSPATVHLL